jgi:hemerythrin-like domain-containing protein
MMYSNRVCERLHDEHMATLALLERLERFVANNKPLEAIDASARTPLIDLAVAFDNEIWRHFGFEEKYLFDYRSTFERGQRSSGLTATDLNGHGMP